MKELQEWGMNSISLQRKWIKYFLKMNISISLNIPNCVKRKQENILLQLSSGNGEIYRWTGVMPEKMERLTIKLKYLSLSQQLL